MEICRVVTDETLREAVRHGDSCYPFAYYEEDIWEFDFHRIDWHWHYELEFLYAAEGGLHCLAGDGSVDLPCGWGILVNSGRLHRYEAESHVLTPNIVFSPLLLAQEQSLIYEKYVAPVLESELDFQALNPDIGWQAQVLQALQQIFALQKADRERELSTVRLLLQIWEILTEYMELPSKPAGQCGMDYRQARLRTMMQYMQDHYREALTLEQIAASAAVSKSSALHAFQSGIHLSPVAYLIQYRLSRAAEQLRMTQKTISAIAEDTGFSSAGYFCRKFRQYYGRTPGEYRNGKQAERKKKADAPHP